MRRLPIRLLCLPLFLLELTGCASTAHRPEMRFVVQFTATRTADHAPIASVAVPVTLGGEGSVKTGARTPAENQPALPAFLARLERTRAPGVYQLVTRVSAVEVTRNKKGKLVRSKRFVGALVPARPGATEIVSTENDPIHLEARLERR